MENEFFLDIRVAAKCATGIRCIVYTDEYVNRPRYCPASWTYYGFRIKALHGEKCYRRENTRSDIIPRISRRPFFFFPSLLLSSVDAHPLLRANYIPRA